MSIATAQDMQHDIELILIKPEFAARKIHAYEANDSSVLIVELTDREAYLMECWWYDEMVANENANRMVD